MWKGSAGDGTVCLTIGLFIGRRGDGRPRAADPFFFLRITWGSELGEGFGRGLWRRSAGVG